MAAEPAAIAGPDTLKGPRMRLTASTTWDGATIQPIRTLDGPREGDEEINQVFFDNVRVPVANRIGKEGEGWTYAKYLLQFERGTAYASGLQAQLRKVKKFANLERSDSGGSMMDDPAFLQAVLHMTVSYFQDLPRASSSRGGADHEPA